MVCTKRKDKFLRLQYEDLASVVLFQKLIASKKQDVKHIILETLF